MYSAKTTMMKEQADFYINIIAIGKIQPLWMTNTSCAESQKGINFYIRLLRVIFVYYEPESG